MGTEAQIKQTRDRLAGIAAPRAFTGPAGPKAGS
jgi:hypothetical protein